MTKRKTGQAVTADTSQKPRGIWSRYRALTRDIRRGFIAEWTVTIIVMLFLFTNVVQGYVIPSASMEGSLLTGDHVFVDKLIFAPPDAISSRL